MKAYMTRLNDGRIFFVTAYTKAEAVGVVTDTIHGVDADDVRKVVRVNETPAKHVGMMDLPNECLIDESAL